MLEAKIGRPKITGNNDDNYLAYANKDKWVNEA